MEDQQENKNPPENLPEDTTKGPSNPVVVTVIVFIVLIIVTIFGFWGYNLYEAKKINEQKLLESATPTPTATATVSASPSDYIFFDSDKREITRGELTGLSEWQLKVARNEIYARHGRSFEHRDLQCYFDKMPWYKTDENYSESALSTLENQNIATILEYEKEINSSYLDYDSGCVNI